MATSPQKVCMLIPSYTPLVGGSEVQLSGLLRNLDRRKALPFVVTRRIAGTSAEGWEGDTPIHRRCAPVRAGTFFFSSLRYLWKRRHDYDVIHVHSLDSPAMAGAIIKHLCPEKRYVQLVPRFGEGSSYERLTRTRLGRARLRFIMGKADAVIPLCPDAGEAIGSLGLPEQKITNIPNGVDVTLFAPVPEPARRALRQSMGIDKNAFVGVVLARLIPRKNVAGALCAWKRLSRSYPNATLVVCGEGPEMGSLRRYYEDHMPKGSVVLNGNTPRDDVLRFLRIADVYLSFSESEGMSNAMLEGMACGLPVLASHGPGIDQLVDHGRTGFLFDSSDTVEASRYLERWAGDSELRAEMSRCVRRVVEERFSFERVARDVEALYEGRSATR